MTLTVVPGIARWCSGDAYPRQPKQRAGRKLSLPLPSQNIANPSRVNLVQASFVSWIMP